MSDFVHDPHSHDGHTGRKIAFALERLSHVFRINWWEANKQLQLSPLQMQILTALRFQPRLDSVSAVAAYFRLTNATISDAVRVLIDKGHVVKYPDPEDGRRHRLALTVAGADAAEDLAQFANRIGEFAAALPDPAAFLDSLLQLMGALQENGYIPLQQMCTTCAHFRRVAGGPSPYYCNLLDKPMQAQDMRVHCADYEPAR